MSASFCLRERAALQTYTYTRSSPGFVTCLISRRVCLGTRISLRIAEIVQAFSFSAGSSTGLPPEARPVIPIEPPSSRKPRSRAVKASTVTKGLGTDADVREPKTPSRATREDLEPFDDSDDEFVNSSKHMPEARETRGFSRNPQTDCCSC